MTGVIKYFMTPVLRQNSMNTIEYFLPRKKLDERKDISKNQWAPVLKENGFLLKKIISDSTAQGTLFLVQRERKKDDGTTETRELVLKLLIKDNSDNFVPQKIRETRANKMLPEAHPNVLTSIDFGSLSHEEYILLEPCDMTLEKLIQQRKENSTPFDKRQLACLAWQIFHGLAAIHRCGICHKDIHTQNILLQLVVSPPPPPPPQQQQQQHGDEAFPYRVKIIDFGFSEPDDSDYCSNPILMPLLAPDLIHEMSKPFPDPGELPFTARHDVWAAGAVLVMAACLDCSPMDPSFSSIEAPSAIAEMLKLNHNALVTKYGLDFLNSVLVKPTSASNKDRPTAEEILDDIDRFLAPAERSPLFMAERYLPGPRTNAVNAEVSAALRIANERRRAQDIHARDFYIYACEYIKKQSAESGMNKLDGETRFLLQHVAALIDLEDLQEIVFRVENKNFESDTTATTLAIAGATATTAATTTAGTSITADSWWDNFQQIYQRANENLDSLRSSTATVGQKANIDNSNALILLEMMKAQRMRDRFDESKQSGESAIAKLFSSRNTIIEEAEKSHNKQFYFVAFQHTRNLSLLRRELLITLKQANLPVPNKEDILNYIADVTKAHEYLDFHRQTSEGKKTWMDNWVVDFERAYWYGEIGNIVEFQRVSNNLVQQAERGKEYVRIAQISFLSLEVAQRLSQGINEAAWYLANFYLLNLDSNLKLSRRAIPNAKKHIAAIETFAITINDQKLIEKVKVIRQKLLVLC